MQPKEKNLTLVYSEKDKRYNFEDKLNFKEDNIHAIRFHSADAYGNKIDFERKIVVDTTNPTIEIKGLPKSGYSNKTTQKVRLTIDCQFNVL